MRRTLADSLYDHIASDEDTASRYDAKREDDQWDRIYCANRVNVTKKFWDECAGRFKDEVLIMHRTFIPRVEHRYIAASVILAMCMTLWRTK